MVIIKKPVKKILYYLSSLIAIIFALILGFFLKNSQYNLSQIENKTRDLFKSMAVSSVARADIPPSGDGGSGAGCGDGDGGSGGGSGDGSGSGS